MGIELESSLIGSLVVSPKKIIDIIDKIKVTDFVNETAQKAFIAIIVRWKKKDSIDIISIVSENPELTGYMNAAISNAYPPSILSFALRIAALARFRRIKTGLNAALQEQNGDEALGQMMGLYQREMMTHGKEGDINSVISRMDSVRAEDRKRGKVGFITGINAHENLYLKYLPGHIWLVGGYTSVGKTAVMIQKLCNLLTTGEKPSVVVVSTEMTEAQVVCRILSNFTGVHSMRILSDNYHSAEEEDMVVTAKLRLKEADMLIYDDIYQLDDIETVFRRAKLQGGVDIGFIDYVQNCRWSGAKSKYEEQAELAKRFQVLAKEVSTTLVCLSQVSNLVGRGETEQFELKGAGEWAAVSDIGIILKRHKTEKHRLLYSIKKNRHGALADCEFDFINEYTGLRENVFNSA